MNKRFLPRATVGLSIAFWLAMSAGAAPNEPAAKAPQSAEVYTPTSLRTDPDLPRTVDGRPDFQGEVWTSDFFPMLEESGMADTLVISDDKAEEMIETMAAGMRNWVAFAIDPEAEDLVIDTKDGLPIVRGQRRSRMVVLPANGRLPYTAAARAEVGEIDPMDRPLDDPEARPLAERCIAQGGLAPNLGTAGLNFLRFVQTPEHVVIHTEYGGEARVIPFSDRHRPEGVSSVLGDSIARWEGDTLVIETIGLPAEDRLRAFPRLIVSADATVVERYTRLTPDELLYQFTVIDPAVYEAEWLGEYSLTRTGGRMYSHECHEGNYSLENILKAGRQADVRREQ